MQDTPESHGASAEAGRSAAAWHTDLRHFVIRVAVVAGAAALLFLAWTGRQALLLTFAAIVVAVIFDAASRPFRTWGGLPQRWALLAGVVTIAVVVGLIGWLVGFRVGAQFGELGTALREAEPTIRGWLGMGGADGSDAGGDGDTGTSVQPYVDWAISATSWGIGAIGAVASLVLVMVAGYFLASEPVLYQRGMAKLFPKDQQDRVEDALAQSGAGLLQWVKGQCLSMLIVALLIGVGAWIIGLPAPLALGLFAGLTAFVPVIGSIVGAAPALVLALAQDGTTLLWTAALILLVQQIESNMIMPIIERHMVHIPPALILLNIFLFSTLFGGLGAIVAAPLTVAVFILISKLYVADVLEHSVDLPAQ